MLQPSWRAVAFQRVRWLRGGSAAVLLLSLGTLAACGSDSEYGDIAIVEGFAGLVAADEPRAAVVGRDVLGNGGTAVDAAVAMYFALAVTRPSRAGLGGGGACVVFQSNSYNDDLSPLAETFVFPAGAAGPVIPMNARAMGVIHARHGLVRWGELLAPAERLARFGHPTSRALAQDIVLGKGIIAGDIDLLREFATAEGALAGEGQTIVRENLSGVLSGISTRGAGYMYQGAFAERVIAAYGALGIEIGKEELRLALPERRAPLELEFGNDKLYLPPSPGGAVSAVALGLLTEVEELEDAGDRERAHLLVESLLYAYADRARALAGGGRLGDLDEDRLEALFEDYDDARHRPAESFTPPPAAVTSNPFASNLAVADRWGSAVACSFSMNGLFGSGRLAPDLGFIVAAPYQAGASNLTPLVVGNDNTGDFRFAAGASGGVAASGALVASLLHAYEADEGLALASVLARARVTHAGMPDIAWVEPGVDAETRAALAERGHEVREAPGIGEVQALFCPEGILDEPEGCSAESDGRGHGLAIIVQ